MPRVVIVDIADVRLRERVLHHLRARQEMERIEVVTFTVPITATAISNELVTLYGPMPEARMYDPHKARGLKLRDERSKWRR